MTDTTREVLELERADPLELLTHMVAYGLAAIVESAMPTPPALSWTASMAPRARVEYGGLGTLEMADLVRCHAERLSQPTAWPQRRIPLAGSDRGLMSPRLARIEDWDTLQERRHAVLDELTRPEAWLDQLLLWSLGEPCYWKKNSQGELLQDEAASRLELQPRNRGSEIVGNRLSPLARAVAARTREEIADALAGRRSRDSIGNDAADSRSAVGFRGPGPVDDVVSWCALWGISQFALNRTLRTTTTAGDLRLRGGEWFFLPIWHDRWTPARLRTVLASAQLRVTAEAFARGGEDEEDDALAATGGLRWLQGRGVKALVLFPVRQFGSRNAPERRAQRGVAHPLKGRAR